MDDQLVLSGDWRAWLVENRLRGAERDALCEALAAQDIPRSLVEAELDAVESSPLLETCQRLRRRASRLAMIVELHRQVRTLDSIDRVSDIDAETFHRDYARNNLPLLVEGYARDWPALARWTPERLAAEYGDVEIEVTRHREDNPRADAQLDQHRSRISMARFIEEISARRTNDVYLVARNRLLRKPELAPLLDDLALDPKIFDRTRLPDDAAMWLGPAGTHVRLHYDTASLFFVQIFGRKRFQLLSPLHGSALVDGLLGFFYEGDEQARPQPIELLLSPGDALYIPVGWFHQVDALDVSVSVGLQCLRQRNIFDWYRPGFDEPLDRWSP